MKRRVVLAAAATAATGVSGCLAGDGGAGGGNGDGGGSDGDCPDGEDCGPAEVTDSSIRTTATGCGSQDTDEVSVSLDGATLAIEGAVWASNPCHEAVLTAADVRDGELSVGVGVESTDQICTECIGEIEYRATVEVSDVYALDSVRVDHGDAGEHTFSMDEIAGEG